LLRRRRSVERVGGGGIVDTTITHRCHGATVLVAAWRVDAVHDGRVHRLVRVDGTVVRLEGGRVVAVVAVAGNGEIGHCVGRRIVRSVLWRSRVRMMRTCITTVIVAGIVR